MNLRQTSASLICAAAALLAQSCVENYPQGAYVPEPPQPPAAPPQYAEGPPPPAAPPANAPDDALVAPIALYPDPLIALILTASTAPGDITAASSYLIQYGDATRLDNQPWDPSVRALAHYPTVISWMAENMDWTQALGAAFLASPSDVMDAVQRLRARALAAGVLASTPQQQVYAEDGEIEIYPAQPDAVYVPVYDSSVVFADGPYYGYGGPFINFGEPRPAGPWLSCYFDWGHRRVWAGDPNAWHEHRGWQPPRSSGAGAPPGAHPWHPQHPGSHDARPGGPLHGKSVPVPRPMQGAPAPPPERFRRPAPQLPSHTSEPRAASPLPGHPGSAGAGIPGVSGRPRQSDVNESHAGPRPGPAGTVPTSGSPKGTSPGPTSPPLQTRQPGANEAHTAPRPSPATAAPLPGQPRPGPAGPSAVSGQARGPVINETRSLPPPPNAHPSSSSVYRGNDSPAPRSAPAHESAPAHAAAPAAAPAPAPAPASNTNTQQPQK